MKKQNNMFQMKEQDKLPGTDLSETDNLEEIVNLLETYNLTRLNQEEIETLNRPITNKEMESVIKNLPVNKKVQSFSDELNHLKNKYQSFSNSFIKKQKYLEKEMAIHSSTIAWKIPWTEEPGSLWGRKESDTTERLHFHFHFRL